MHIKKIYKDNELSECSINKKFLLVQKGANMMEEHLPIQL